MKRLSLLLLIISYGAVAVFGLIAIISILAIGNPYTEEQIFIELTFLRCFYSRTFANGFRSNPIAIRYAVAQISHHDCQPRILCFNPFFYVIYRIKVCTFVATTPFVNQQNHLRKLCFVP